MLSAIKKEKKRKKGPCATYAVARRRNNSRVKDWHWTSCRHRTVTKGSIDSTPLLRIDRRLCDVGVHRKLRHVKLDSLMLHQTRSVVCMGVCVLVIWLNAWPGQYITRGPGLHYSSKNACTCSSWLDSKRLGCAPWMPSGSSECMLHQYSCGVRRRRVHVSMNST